MLTFENPPATDIPAPTTADIRSALASHPGMWAVVYRADRLQRAEALAARITDGAAYGAGHEAIVRKVGAECRVYARYVSEDVRGCSCGMADYGAPGHDGHDS
jgi:hypothetical protein